MSLPSILSKLRNVNSSNLISVYIPSAGKEMTFTPLSVKQQKDLIKSSMDGNLAGITFSNIINQIVLDNSTEKYKFLVTDRYPILISLRKQSFGGEFTLKDEEKSTVFDLDVILKRQLKFSEPNSVQILLDKTSLKVNVDIISIEDDIKINNFQIEKLKKTKDNEDISETVGSLFVYEILKFVSKLSIDDEEVDLVNMPIKDRVSVIESLPVTLNNEVLSYIQSLRGEENEYITINGQVLPLDPRFFSKE